MSSKGFSYFLKGNQTSRNISKGKKSFDLIEAKTLPIYTQSGGFKPRKSNQSKINKSPAYSKNY